MSLMVFLLNLGILKTPEPILVPEVCDLILYNLLVDYYRYSLSSTTSCLLYTRDSVFTLEDMVYSIFFRLFYKRL